MLLFEKITTFLNRGDQRSLTVKRNIVGSILIKGCSILISLLLVPLTLGYLSAELYGVWLTLSSVVLWLNFLDVGLTLGLKNKLAEAIACNDWERGRSLVSTTYLAMLAVFVPLGVILVMIVPSVNWSDVLNIAPIYNSELSQVVTILIVCFCLQMIFNVITAVLAAFQQVALSSVFPVIGNFFACIIIYILTKTTEGSLLNLAVSISFLPVVVLIIGSFVLYRRHLSKVAPNLFCMDFSLIKRVFGLGVRFFIIQIQIIVLYQSTSLLIAHVATPVDVTTYNIAYKYLGIISMLFSIVMGPLWPAFTDAYVKQDYLWMKQAYKKLVHLCCLLTCGLLLLMVISQPVYSLWIGNSVLIPWSMTIMVGVYMMVYMWGTLHVLLINGIGKVKLQTYITMIGLCLHLPLALTLGKYLGACGVICSMIIVNLVYLLFFTLQLHKLMNRKAVGVWNL